MTSTSSDRIAAFFDLDKTVIARSSALAFTRPFFDGGLLTRRAMLRSAVAQLQFLLASTGDDQVERLRKHVTDMCTGWDAGLVREIVSETLEEVVRPAIFSEAAALIEQHRRAGHEIVLISASGIEMVEPIGRLLGADVVRASIMRVVDGRYSGELEFYCFGEAKAIAMRSLADERGYRLDECYAYSDSSTDLPMLTAVGHPAVVNPDRALRRHATENGWEIFDFPNPLPASPWSSKATVTRTALCATGIGAAAAAAIVYQLRHSKNARSEAA
ncbi:MULTISPECIES: HAD family hydrolase [Gordonia]|uniref:HAD-IB family hydrolase n=1 Tax=Gordonia cholesterolivorans TaxID=559625 RepID=A0ABN3H5M0_9ACTN|nr:HAD-IB family hydrolase [Gordonia sihwensis]KJR09436.1 inhibition of morphological differentiation protein [Gordonia sihwensis]MBY4568873.1 inhibition of morphological differentiation protein [Gordonia sihwensis]WFN92583.1 HAD-IB family hydrolase [Gordonia sihwensis]